MPELRDEITAMETAYDAIEPLPAELRQAVIAAVADYFGDSYIQAVIDEAERLGLIEDAT